MGEEVIIEKPKGTDGEGDEWGEARASSLIEIWDGDLNSHFL